MGRRRIGVLTGGGDCPGLNAVIRAVVKTATLGHGVETVGILDGYQGLVEDRVVPLDRDSVSGILDQGGTILGTNNRAAPARYPDGIDADGNPRIVDATERCLATAQRHGLDALVVIGGDGTMSCSAPIAQAGLPVIGVPKTIDNDLVGTDLTFGFTTAASTATESLDRLHTTAESHHRVIVCELMGRNAGWLTLESGVASGADVILLPELPFQPEVVCDFVQSRRAGGRGFSIVACAEGARIAGQDAVVARRVQGSPDPIRLGGIGALVADLVERETGIETRTTVLGHVQRGGAPVAADRVLATQFGHAAVEFLLQGAENQVVVLQNGTIEHIDLMEVTGKQRLVPTDHPLIRAAQSIGTCFGVS